MNLERCIKVLFFVCSVVGIIQGWHNRRHYRHVNTVVCSNGIERTGRCVCDPGYIGKHCENKSNCRTPERNQNGTCKSCHAHYEGDYCQHPICEHGEKDVFEPKCICEKPYSGEFCQKVETADIYLYYNSRMAATMGPFGALILIPLLACYYGCENKAKNRQVQRIGELMSDQNVSIDPDAVKHLLK